MANELVHGTVGTSLTQAEFEAIGLHVFNSQASGDVLFASSTTQLSRLAKGTDGDFLTSGTPPTWTTHATDLDAHTYNIYQTLRTGSYFMAFPGSVYTGIAIAANTLYACPLLVPRAMTIDRLAVDITAAAAGKVAMLGVYTVGTNTYPGALVASSNGEISVATAVPTALTLTSLALSKGLHWAVIVSDGVPSIARMSLGSPSPLGLWETDFTYIYRGWSVAHTYGALPDPFTAGGSLVTVTYAVIPRLLTLA